MDPILNLGYQEVAMHTQYRRWIAILVAVLFIPGFLAACGLTGPADISWDEANRELQRTCANDSWRADYPTLAKLCDYAKLEKVDDGVYDAVFRDPTTGVEVGRYRIHVEQLTTPGLVPTSVPVPSATLAPGVPSPTPLPAGVCSKDDVDWSAIQYQDHVDVVIRVKPGRDCSRRVTVAVYRIPSGSSIWPQERHDYKVGQAKSGVDYVPTVSLPQCSRWQLDVVVGDDVPQTLTEVYFWEKGTLVGSTQVLWSNNCETPATPAPSLTFTPGPSPTNGPSPTPTYGPSLTPSSTPTGVSTSHASDTPGPSPTSRASNTPTPPASPTPWPSDTAVPSATSSCPSCTAYPPRPSETPTLTFTPGPSPTPIPGNCLFRNPDKLDDMPKTVIELFNLNEWSHRVFNTRLFRAPDWDGADSWFVTLALGPHSGGFWTSYYNPGQIIHRGTDRHQSYCIGVLTTSAWMSQFLDGASPPAQVSVKIGHDQLVNVRTWNGRVISQATSDQGDITITLPNDGVTVVWTDFWTDAPTFDSVVHWGPDDRIPNINRIDAR